MTVDLSEIVVTPALRWFASMPAGAKLFSSGPTAALPAVREWIAGADQRMDAQLRLGVEAIVLTETARLSGWQDFHGHRVPRILYEPHVMWRALEVPSRLRDLLPHCLCHERWGETSYGKHSEQWRKLIAAGSTVGMVYAARACSWGLGQVLGEGWRTRVKAPDIRTFVAAQFFDAGQWASLAQYVRHTPGLADAIRREDAHTVGRAYNGPKYESHGWHTRWASHLADLKAGDAERPVTA